MSKEHSNQAISMVLGAVATVGIGTFLLHALSALILGIIGATAGWIFQTFIRPALDRWNQRRLAKKNQDKA